MPLYRYVCQNCEHEFEELAKDWHEMIPCPKCSISSDPQMPSGAEQVTLETKDGWRGVKVPKGQDKALRKRMKNYQSKYEMAEMIEHNGMDTAKRNGWLKKIKKI